MRGSSSTSELVEQAARLRAEEAHGEQHELGRDLAVGALDLLEAAVLHLHLVEAQRADVAVVVAEEALGVHGVDAVAALLVGGGDLVAHRVGGPRVGVGPAVDGAGEDLELRDRAGAVAVRGAEAVGAGVAAADDDHVLAAGVDRHVVDGEVALLGLVRPGQVLHRLVDAAELAARARAGRATAVAPPASTSASNSLAQLVDVEVDADLDAGAELGALGLHLLEAPVEVALLHLELGDAVAEQPADAVGPLEHDDAVAGAGELLGGGQAGGPGADHRDAPCRWWSTAAPAPPSPRPTPGR